MYCRVTLEAQWFNPVNIRHGVHLMAFEESQYALQTISLSPMRYDTRIFQAFESKFDGTEA